MSVRGGNHRRTRGGWKPRAVKSSPRSMRSPWPPRKRYRRKFRWTYNRLEILVVIVLLLGLGGYQLVTKGSQGFVTERPQGAYAAPFRNCAAARAAGETPIFRDHPRWGDHLDADGDGRACEPIPTVDR